MCDMYDKTYSKSSFCGGQVFFFLWPRVIGGAKIFSMELLADKSEVERRRSACAPAYLEDMEKQVRHNL